MAKEKESRIKMRRKSLNMTMDQLAEKTGYTTSTKKTVIYHIESRNDSISALRLPMFSSALNTNVYYLLGMIDDADLTDAEIIKLVREKQDSISYTLLGTELEPTNLPDSDFEETE